ncbi:hypothetical protein ACT3RT_10015 [Ewingella sp. AOP9-I1-14]
MKWEILKCSEDDFEGAPEWATQCIWCDKGSGHFVYWLNPATSTMFNPACHTKPDFWGGEYGHRNYIESERRPITEPDVNQQLNTEWSGEGLPPVGIECEMQNDECKWIPVDIIAHKDGFAFGWSYDYRLVFFSDAAFEFRPIRSAEDVARDEAISEMLMMEGGMPDSYQPHELVAALYDAGYRKVE